MALTPAPEDNTVETQLARLRERLDALEDERSIRRLLDSYGPLADSGSTADTVGLWTQGGSYEFSAGDAIDIRTAPAQLADLYESAFHRELIARGSSHLTSPAIIEIDGREARACAYSYVIVRRDRHWLVERAAINFWELVKDDRGWRIRRRINRVLDGSPQSHELMRRMWHGR